MERPTRPPGRRSPSRVSHVRVEGAQRRSCHCGFEVVFEVWRGVLRHQAADVRADEVIDAIAEQLLCARIAGQDPTVERSSTGSRRATNAPPRPAGPGRPGLASLGSVANAGHDQGPIGDAERGQADVDRDLAPITAPADEVPTGAHRPGVGRRAVALPMLTMVAAEALRHEKLDGSSHQLLGRVVEELLRLLVHADDDAIHVYDDGRVGHQCHERAEEVVLELGRRPGGTSRTSSAESSPMGSSCANGCSLLNAGLVARTHSIDCPASR